MPANTSRSAARLAATVLLVLLVSGCAGKKAATNQTRSKPADNGVAAKTADQILGAGRDALRGASSVRIVGKMGQENETFEFDLRIGKAGAQGTMKVGGPSLELVRVNGRLYLRGRGFWERFGSQRLATLIGDRWVLASTGGSGAQAFASFRRFTELGGWDSRV